MFDLSFRFGLGWWIACFDDLVVVMFGLFGFGLIFVFEIVIWLVALIWFGCNDFVVL